jgi:two-component system chemotaxis response regulator CheY
MVTRSRPADIHQTDSLDDITMQNASAAVLKLKPVLDLGAAEEFLITMRQQLDAADVLHLDASAVQTLTTPCIQIILAAIKGSDTLSVVTPSAEFTSAFTDLQLTFPQAEATAMPRTDGAAAVAHVTETQTAQDTPAMAKRILTIDDSKTIRDMLRMTLVDAGFEVLQAVDGQEGVEVMTRERVDLVITDINMPKMNGYEVVRHLRNIPAHKGLPILVLTTESDTDKKNLARDAGATGWMVKPFDPDRLVATVRKVIP